MLAKLKPEPNAGAVPGAEVEPKTDVEDPKADELDEPKSEGEVLAPKPGVDAPNIEVVADEVDPKGLDVDEVPKGEDAKAGVDEGPKAVLPKVGVLGANGLEDVEDENRLADDWPNADDEANGFDGVPEAPNPIALAT